MSQDHPRKEVFLLEAIVGGYRSLHPMGSRLWSISRTDAEEHPSDLHAMGALPLLILGSGSSLSSFADLWVRRLDTVCC